MKTVTHTANRLSLIGLFLAFGILSASAQDGIYDDIYQAPPNDAGSTGTSNPLDGYSTYDQDDYYQPQNPSSTQNPSTSEQYVDENGDTYITNNYYGDDDYDYMYASRINRFHRPIYGYGYYDPFYTNMYWYTYDPYFYGTSIYAAWGWGGFYSPFYRPWGYSMWGMSYGWNSWGAGWGYSPYCYGGHGMGWNNYGMGYNNGYNHGYWNGYYDGLASGGGYYNTYDQNSGIYYGHRGGAAGTDGSGIRSNSLGDRYNRAAAEGIVSHANRNNILQTADARPVVGRTAVDGRTFDRNTMQRDPGNGTRQIGTQPVRTPSGTTAPVRTPATEGRDAIRPNRDNIANPQRVPQPTQRDPQAVPQRNPQQSNPQVAPQRNPQSVPQRTPQATPQRTPQSYGNRVPQDAPQRTRPSYQAPERTPQQPYQPQRDVYQRGSAPNTTAPTYRHSAPEQRPSQQAPSRNYGTPQQNPRNVAPSRPEQQPRTAPSRESTPSRDLSPQRSAPSPSRNVSPSPSRGGSFSSPSRGGGGSAPRSSGRKGG
ncbi:MAG: hypothetical protein K9J06_11835 [Flavobacteriales bacterium]|nr:hypothetical protein [Flavobacteriales bacterium]